MRKNVEGQVYLCTWKKVGDKFRLWLKANPKLSSTNSDFEAADEDLADKILIQFGDGENVREYVPQPPPTKPLLNLLEVPVVAVTGNTHSQISGDPSLLFSGGVCKKCGSCLGERTKVPLSLDYIGPGYDAGFVWQKPFQFFSEGFLELLKPKERSCFEWRLITLKRRSRKVFHEMRPKAFVPFVAVKGLKFDVIVCRTCKTLRGLHSFNKGTPIYHYVSFSDLPRPLPSCFAVGSATNFRLCFARDRWLRLAGKPGTKGIVSNPIGVVDERLCERVPEI